MRFTRIVCSLALALGIAAPAYAQFDLLRKLVPQIPAMGYDPAARQHAEAVNAIVQRRGMGDLKEALRLADALVAEDRKAQPAALPFGGSLLSQSLSIAADLHEQDGNYARAIELYELQAQIPRAGRGGFGLPGDISARWHIGQLQLKMGDFPAAKRSFQDALARPEIATPIATLLRPKLYACLGKAALYLGDDALAESSLLLAIREDPMISGQDPAGAAGKGNHSFEIMTVMGAALGQAQDVLKSMSADNVLMDSNGEVLSSATGRRLRLPTILNIDGPLTDLAALHFRRRDDAALKALYSGAFSAYAARSERVNTQGIGPSAQLEKQYARFGAYFAGLKQYDLAQQAFDHALRLNATRLSAAAVGVTPEYLTGFFAARRQLLDLVISLRVAMHSDAAAWRLTLGELMQSKGLQSDFLVRRARIVGLSTDPETRRLATEMASIDVAGSAEQYVRRANLASALQSKVGKLLPPLTFQAGDGFVAEVQKRLQDENMLFLSVFTLFDFDSQQFGPQHYLGAWVNPEDVRIADLGSAEALDSLGATLRADLTQRPKAGAAQTVLPAARSTYDVLLKPLLGASAAPGAWVADLDGAMSLLPMEALADARGRYLIEDTEWRYVSSARALLSSASSGLRDAPGQAVVLAAPDYDLESTTASATTSSLSRGAALQGMRFAPLPQTLSEGKAVAAALQRKGTNVALRAGADASMQALSGLHAPRYLHIATHGFFVEEGGTWRRELTGFDHQRYIAESYAQGRSSGLALAGANRSLAAGVGDGVVYAAQLRQLDLAGTELAVLSACDTSMGAVALGEGVDSLRQALDVAGVATTVTSLWPVPDTETRELMTDFYDGLAAATNKTSALHGAKLHVKHGHPHPYYWAAFVISGRR